jgi:tetratricopeptide (TPR) repeat protein
MLVALSATPARTAEKLVVGPAPAWVKPAEISIPKAADEGRSYREVLDDRQFHFGPEGDSQYVERVFRIQNTMGLQAMGTITLPWTPMTDTLTVHKLHILRDGKTIDVLAKQSFATIRRETDLDEATIDGRLTATLLPEGLQTGDVIDMAYTLTRQDPVVAGRSEWSTMVNSYRPAERVRLRATWPTSKKVEWQATPELGKPKLGKASDGESELSLDLHDLKPLRGPTGAPSRFYPRRLLEFSDFQSWAEVSALMAPLYVKASTLTAGSPLKAEVEKIRAASPDPKVRAAAALKLVQDKVRYVAMVITDGGLTPVAADATWSRRFGDCKAKTALLIALLRELGIEAQPALVNAYGGDGLDQRLPSVSAFDHVIVRARIGEAVYWLDGTRSGDIGLDTIAVPPFHWALPVQATDATLVALVQKPLDKPTASLEFTIDASAGLLAPAKAHVEMIARGEGATFLKYFTDEMPAAERNRLLADSMKGRSPGFKVTSVKVVSDAAIGEAKIVIDGTGPLGWQTLGDGITRFWVNEANLGWKADFKRGAEEPADAPYAVAFPQFTSFSLKLTLPNHGRGFALDAPNIDTKVAGRALFRSARIEGGIATIETSQKSLAPEFPAKEASAAEEALAELAKTRVSIKAPLGYQLTKADIEVTLKVQPKTATELIRQGYTLFEARRLPESRAAYEKAIALDPKAAYAYANRALLDIREGKLDLARADIDKAMSLDSRNYVALHAEGLLALNSGNATDAVVAFTRASDIRAGDVFALLQRSSAYVMLNQSDKALADLAEVVRIDPEVNDARIRRTEIYASKGDEKKATEELNAALKAHPDNDYLHVYMGGLLARYGHLAEAEPEFAAAIAIRPSPEAYLTRARWRPVTDTAGKLQDIDLALKLDPTSSDGLRMKTKILVDRGQAAEAVAILDRALKSEPDNTELWLSRAQVNVKASRLPRALQDFAEARKRSAGNAARLNSLCWDQATLGVALADALADCDAALRLAPQSAATLDSRGFVLLRLGRYKESVEAYDAALKLRPDQGASLFGRGLSKLRLGMKADGDADLAAARASSKSIDKTFAEYGVGAG